MISTPYHNITELKFQAELYTLYPVKNLNNENKIAISKGPLYTYDSARNKDLELVAKHDDKLYIIPIEVKTDDTFNWISNIFQHVAYNYINYSNSQFELVYQYGILLCPSLAILIDYSKCPDFENDVFDFYSILS